MRQRRQKGVVLRLFFNTLNLLRDSETRSARHMTVHAVADCRQTRFQYEFQRLPNGAGGGVPGIQEIPYELA
jgi:hypothetical protein